jgi:hypothetical protein
LAAPELSPVLARSLRLAAALALLVCAACLSDHPVVRLDAGRELPWLVAEQTTLAEIEAQLGPPDASHEEGRIRTWRLDSANLHTRKGHAWSRRRLVVQLDEQQRAAHVFGSELPWLVKGTTTRAEIEQHLGPANEVYGAQPSYIWWLDENGDVVRDGPAMADRVASRSLVVVFGAGERAQRVSLVQLW